MKKTLILFVFSVLLNASSNYDEAMKLMKNKEYIKAYNLFVDDANSGNAKSQLMIGRFFLQGNSVVDKDYTKALHYFSLASKQKLYDANCYIAYIYANGLGVMTNFGRASVFAKSEYKKRNKLCVKVWNDFNLQNYPTDKGFKIGDYLKPEE